VWYADWGHYGWLSSVYYRALTERGISEWIQTILYAERGRGPLLPFLTQFLMPLRGWFAYPQTVFLLVNPLAEFATLILLASVIQRLWGRRLLTVVILIFVCSTPLFLGMSYRFFTEPLQGLAVAGMIYVFVAGESWGWAEVILGTGACFSIGLLAKPSTPLFQAPFAVAAILHCARRGWGPSFRASLPMRLVACFFGVAVTLAALGWYAVNLKEVGLYVRWASVSPMMLHYGSSLPFLGKLRYWIVSYLDVLSPRWLQYALGSTGGCIFVYALAFRRRWERADLAALLSLVTIASAIVVFAFSINEDIRYTFALLPPTAIGLAWVVARLPGQVMVLALGTALLLQFGALFGQVSDARRPGSLRQYHWSVKADASAIDRINRVLSAVCSEREEVYVLGSETSDFEANALSFYSAMSESGHRCKFVQARWLTPGGEPHPEAAYRAIKSRRYRKVIIDALEHPPDRLFNSIRDPLQRLIENDAAFRKVRIPIDSVSLYELVP